MTPTSRTKTLIGLKHIDHLNLSVRNLAESAAWYSRVLDFEQVEEGLARGTPYRILRSGAAMLCLYEHPQREFLAGDQLKARSMHGFNHFAVRITDRTAWEARIKQERLEVNYGGKVSWPHSTAWYVNDPTGYEIEVVLWNNDQIAFD